jgi:sugar phosphate isomerase/epimerase
MAEFLESELLFRADVFFEVDTYWVKTAGSELLFRSGLLFRLDPAEVVRKLGERAPLLHIKDGPCLRDAPMTAVGQGVMDFPAIVAAAEGRTEWMIVELDSCATDMWKAVEESYRYLIEKGLAYGRKN